MVQKHTMLIFKKKKMHKLRKYNLTERLRSADNNDILLTKFYSQI